MYKVIKTAKVANYDFSVCVMGSTKKGTINIIYDHIDCIL